MKRLALVGYFGWGNFGDELFLESHRQHLAQEYDLEVANDLTRSPYFSNGLDGLMKRVDGVIIGGGDLLNPVAVSKLYWRSEYLRKPTFVFGLGVPNVKRINQNAIDHYRTFFADPNCKLVVARDVESFNWLKKTFDLGDRLHWYPDPVCSLRRPARVVPQEKTLGVVMREHHSLDPDLSNVRKLIDSAKDQGYRVKHLVLANKELGQADLGRARSIAMPDEEIVASESLDELCEAISSCSQLATIKFHGMVVATMYGIPSIAMSVTPKNRNFLRMIERPEMLSSYRSDDLPNRLSHYPAAIPQRVRASLFRQSTNGYTLLKQKLEEHV